MACPATIPTLARCACGAPVSGPHAKLCLQCAAARRHKPAKWVPTPEIDRQIAEAYHKYRAFGSRTSLANVAARIGWPKFAVTHHAVKLGLARTKELPWSSEEVSILIEFGWMSEASIQRKLKAAGFARSPMGIHLKRDRLKIQENPDWYSAHRLALALGEDGHRVGRWIRQGLLHAEQRGWDRHDKQHGDAYLITTADVRAFLIGNPNEYDLAKVDKVWFLEVITGQAAGDPGREEETLG